MAEKFVIPIHGQDHCPGGPDPIPCLGITGFHAHRNTTLTVNSGNSAQLTWDEWTIDSASIFEEGVLSGARLTDVICTTEGWYSIHAWAYWDTQPATGFGGLLMIHDNTNIFEPSLCQGVTYPTNFHVQGAMTFQVTRYLPPVFMHDPTSLIDRIEFWVIQNSGVSRTIDEAYCNIAFHGVRKEDS